MPDGDRHPLPAAAQRAGLQPPAGPPAAAPGRAASRLLRLPHHQGQEVRPSPTPGLPADRGPGADALRYLKLILKASDRIGCLIAPRLSLEHIVCCYSYCFFCGQSVSLANASERYLSI